MLNRGSPYWIGISNSEQSETGEVPPQDPRAGLGEGDSKAGLGKGSQELVPSPCPTTPTRSISSWPGCK